MLHMEAILLSCWCKQLAKCVQNDILDIHIQCSDSLIWYQRSVPITLEIT